MGSPCLFTRQQALKTGYSFWLHVKSSNHLHTELNCGYLEDTKFYLESKACFIHVSSFASFKPFLIARLWGYCAFSNSSVVSLISFSKIHPVRNYFTKTKHVLQSNFFLLQICSLLDCS